jgi:hypothetical protein
MISLKNQNDINNQFKTIFKNLILKFKLDTSILIETFNAFEKNDIKDESTKKLIKLMLDIPYYEQFKEVNILKKFKILKQLLLIIHENIIIDNLNLRLQKLRS